MKRYISKLTAIMILAMTFSFASSAQIVVKVRPLSPVVKIRPASPGPRHSWVTGEYVYRGGQYIYTDGYWAEPPLRRTHWVEGRWKHRRGGWIWIPGHWK